MKEISLWGKIVGAIKRLFGFEALVPEGFGVSNALAEAERVLVKMLDNYDKSTYDAIRDKLQRSGRGRRNAVLDERLESVYYGEQNKLNISKSRIENLGDIDKDVSLRIESEFEKAIAEIRKIVPRRDRPGFDFALEGDIKATSKDCTKELESTYEEYLGRLLSAYRVGRGETGEIAQRSLTENVARILRGGVRPSMEGTSQIAEEDGIPQQIWEKALPVALASRELEYRRIRRDAFRDRYGLNPGDTVSLPQLEEIFNATNPDKEVRALFEKVIALAKSLGVEVKVEENDGEKGAP